MEFKLDLKHIAKACSKEKYREHLKYIHVNHEQKRIEATNGVVCLIQNYETEFTDRDYIDPNTLEPNDCPLAYPDIDRLIPQVAEHVVVRNVSYWREKGKKRGKYVLFELSNGREIFFDDHYLKMVRDFIPKEFDFYFISENKVAMFKGVDYKTALIMPVKFTAEDREKMFDKL